MHPSFLAELSHRRPAIKQAWERKLRLEPITSPLANPDTLVLLMDRTLEELIRSLATRCETATSGANRAPRTGCLCGLNPLLAYFRVAASVLPAQMCSSADHCPELSATEYTACLQEMMAEIHVIAADEIRSFCAMCQTEIARGGRSAANNLATQSFPVLAK